MNHDLIFQLIYNLLNNAIRYNKPAGCITIKDCYVPGKPYQLTISDTGIGIEEELIGTIFDRFKKIEKKENEGYGLGLSIVHTIARHHNIKIEVSSWVDVGTTVALIFPPAMVTTVR
jgi:signal transduction histidine kinase